MSTNDIDIDVDGVAISTTNQGEHGIVATHAGGTATTPVHITIDVTGTSTKNTISTAGNSADGIGAEHTGTGNVDIDVTGVGISTTDASARGVYGSHTGTGNVDITIEGTTTGRTISTAGTLAHGVYGEHSGAGNVDIDLEDIGITTTAGATGAADAVRVDHSGAGNVDIEATGVSISTSGSPTLHDHGVSAMHTGTGNIDITINGKKAGTTTTPSTITTTSQHSNGVHAQQDPATGETGGDIAITLGDVQIDTSDGGNAGVRAQHKPTSSGTLAVTLNPGVTITSKENGVSLSHENSDPAAVDNDLTLIAQGITVRTKDDLARGFLVSRQFGRGEVTVDVDGSTITTEGDTAVGISALHQGDEGDGGITVDARNGGITTGSVIDNEDGTTTPKGHTAHGIYAFHRYASTPENAVGVGDIRITTRNFDITTTGTALHSNGQGTFAYGIYAGHEKVGNTVIDVQTGSSITTEGQNSHGIVAYHWGTTATRAMTITVGGPVTVNGAGAQGVRIGTISSGAPARMAALDEESYRRQTVTVNSGISSQGEGIFLANGGRVIIGPSGSIASESGIAILATGTVPAVADDPNTMDINEAMDAIPPKLRVDLNLGGRRVAQAIGNDWILNDGGETTIAMNGVVLHDGATGVTGKTARNGAWNVRMQAGGVKVEDRTNADPAMWTVSERAENVIADRDFSAEDFTEARRRSPAPPPPPEPDPPAIDAAKLGEVVEGAVANALGGIVVSLPSGEGEGSASPFVEEYAPRAAIYEALPGALVALNDAGLGTGAPPSPGSLSFARTHEGNGGASPAGSTVGQSHGFGYGSLQSGWTMALGETLGASLAFHHLWGSVGVDAGTGGGGLGIEATGFVVDGAWRHPDGFYGKAGLATTRYDIRAGSDDPAVGMLAGGVGAEGSLVRLEAGREMALAGDLEVAPRLWLKRSALSVDDFVDAVGSRVSVPDLTRTTGGVGMTARTGSGMLALEGSFDLAHVFDGATTVTDVSGARLVSQAQATELRLALSGAWRGDGVSLAAQASMNGPDAGGALGVRLAVQF